ncbi:MAG: methylmalonyl-CoA epimerase [Firmicutes bacterium]|jgi:methylmalonyl-CoA/ethylmalonyl-CoA epimerase|nr:methylmalonyl-CoA epimerase [Bacillota bacterium]
MKLDHLGVAVRHLDQAITVYEAMGLEVAHREQVTQDQVSVAFIPFDGGRFELLEPTADSSPIAKFLQRRGPGLHHVALEVSDIRKTLGDLQKRGLQLIDSEPRPGADQSLVAFVHPSATGGILLELVQHGEDLGE